MGALSSFRRTSFPRQRLAEIAWFGFVFIFGLGPRPAESKDKLPTVVEWMSLKGADQPTLSPDGRHVAYHVRSADWEADGFDDEIWVVDVASRKSYQLTNTKGSNRGQSWSPAGRQLAFLSAREGGTQIYLATPPSPEVMKLTEAPNGINEFRWSPDGRRIASHYHLLVAGFTAHCLLGLRLQSREHVSHV